MISWRASGERWLMLIPVGLYLSLGLIYLLAVPVGESPDEPGHLQCIEQVAQYRRLPRIDPWPSGEWWSRTTLLSGHMCYHMPLYYVAAGSLQLAVHSLGQSPLHFEFPESNPQWANGSPSMFVHERNWQLAETQAVTAVRIFTLAIGLLTLWATYRVTVALFPGQHVLALAAATLVAGWPQFVYMSRAISNDLLATALSAAVLVVVLQEGRPSRYPLAAGLASLAFLTKLTAAFTAGIVLAAFALEFWQRPAQRRELARAGLLMTAIFAGSVALIALVPALREPLVRGVRAFAGVSPAASSTATWLDVLKRTASSGWARFGWMNVAAPSWQAYAWWLTILGGAVGGLFALWRRHPRPSSFLIAVLALWAVAVLAGYLRINLNRFQPQFRFAFALLPVLGGLAAGGYRNWLGRRSYLGVGVLALALFLVNLWLIFQLVIPAYAV